MIHGLAHERACDICVCSTIRVSGLLLTFCLVRGGKYISNAPVEIAEERCDVGNGKRRRVVGVSSCIITRE